VPRPAERSSALLHKPTSSNDYRRQLPFPTGRGHFS
jgi:hypothetical protein